jgi:hypothetical protein
MKVTIKARTLIHDRLGTLHAGQVVDLPEAQAREFVRRGFVEHYQTKVIHSSPATPGNPLGAAGMAQQSSALPVAQALPQTTSSESGLGKRKRGRPRNDQSS